MCKGVLFVVAIFQLGSAAFSEVRADGSMDTRKGGTMIRVRDRSGPHEIDELQTSPPLCLQSESDWPNENKNRYIFDVNLVMNKKCLCSFPGTDSGWWCERGDKCQIDKKNNDNPRKTKCMKKCEDADTKLCKKIAKLWTSDEHHSGNFVKNRLNEIHQKCLGKDKKGKGFEECRRSCGCDVEMSEKEWKFDEWREGEENVFVWMKTSIYGACRVSGKNDGEPSEKFTMVARGVPSEELCAQRCAREPTCAGYEYSKYKTKAWNNKCHDPADGEPSNGGKCELHWIILDGDEPDRNPDFSCYSKVHVGQLKYAKNRCKYLCDQFVEEFLDWSDSVNSCDDVPAEDWTWLKPLISPFDYQMCKQDPKYLYTHGYFKCFGTKCQEAMDSYLDQ